MTQTFTSIGQRTTAAEDSYWHTERMQNGSPYAIRNWKLKLLYILLLLLYYYYISTLYTIKVESKIDISIQVQL